MSYVNTPYSAPRIATEDRGDSQRISPTGVTTKRAQRTVGTPRGPQERVPYLELQSLSTKANKKEDAR